MIRLPDEKMLEIASEFQKDILATGEVGNLCKAISEAQLKKVYRWGNEYCPHCNKEREGLKRWCAQCWQALLGEMKE